MVAPSERARPAPIQRMNDYADIRYDLADHIATITLCRPERLNSFTTSMKDELCDAFDRADLDDDVRAVVLTGSGRAFCAGADLSRDGERFGLRDASARAEEHHDRGGTIALRIYRSAKPVIAAINGPAVGVGITMTLPADIRMVSTRAKIAFPFTRIGIVPEACSTWFLPRIVGISKAAEWCYSGRFIEPDEAVEARLVRSVHEAEELLPAARRLAHELVDQSSPVAVSMTRRLLWQMLASDEPLTAHRITSKAMFALGTSADVDEGMAAFREHRPAQFPMQVSVDSPSIWDP